MTLIGDSISDAIDWTQDRLVTTRPLAESTLFSLLHSKIIVETEDGFVLLEAENNDEEIKKQHRHAKDNFHKNYKVFRFRNRHTKFLKKNLKNLNENQRNLPPSDDDDSTDDGQKLAP